MLITRNNAGVCGWCRQRFARPQWGSGESLEYCTRQHQIFANRVASGNLPVIACPRCQCRDLIVATPDWAICQTCGYQTDRPDLMAGAITPRGSLLTGRGIKQRLAEGG